MSQLSEDEEFELLSLERERTMANTQGNPVQSATVQSQIPDIASEAVRAATRGPYDATKKFFQTDPATMQRVGGPVLPIVGGMAGGPIGAALGELARQASGTALAPDTVPKSPLGRFASTMTAGIAQEPKILQAIPGVPQVSKLVSNLAGKAGQSLANVGQALTGAKAQDLEQAAKQGLSTYGAPSLEKAQEIFGDTLAKEGVNMTPKLRQTFDPQLATARKVALDVGSKIEEGTPIGAEEALRARQAADRIYNATPIMDRAGRRAIQEWRGKFDDILASQSGDLKDASTMYRQAIVKSNLLNPLRITKQGQMSAVAPMIATLAASAGMGSGHKEESGLGALGYLAASSPLMAGLGATAGGSAARAFGALAARPEVRQALLQVLQRIQANRNGDQ